MGDIRPKLSPDRVARRGRCVIIFNSVFNNKFFTSNFNIFITFKVKNRHSL
jgi:hypothetical protein